MLPLEHVRVVDLTRAVPGPYCTMLLGDMGAEVLVIEAIEPRMQYGDPEREPLRRNKRSIRVDLKRPEGRAIVHRLAAAADVVVEGFRPGVAARLGVDAQTLRTLNDRLVVCSLSGYGQTGPYATMAGHDIDYVAIGGALGAIGRPGGPPAIPLNLVGDLAGGGLMAAFAIVVALLARERTGRGQAIDLGMTDGVLSLMTRKIGQVMAGGTAPEPGSDRITGALPHYDVYRCRDGRWLAVGALEPWFLRNLCEAIGAPELAAIGEDASAEERARARARYEAIFLERTRDEWFALLRDGDACAAPVLSVEETLRDPHLRAREMFVAVEHPTLGPLEQVGIAAKLSGTPGAVRTAGPAPGAHTDEVLRELGLSDEEVGALRAARVVE